MKIYLVQIDTEDGEHYFYVYDYKPTNKELKEKFFEDYSDYPEEDWGVCICPEISERKLIVKHI